MAEHLVSLLGALIGLVVDESNRALAPQRCGRISGRLVRVDAAAGVAEDVKGELDCPKHLVAVLFRPARPEQGAIRIPQCPRPDHFYRVVHSAPLDVLTRLFVPISRGPAPNHRLLHPHQRFRHSGHRTRPPQPIRHRPGDSLLHRRNHFPGKNYLIELEI